MVETLTRRNDWVHTVRDLIEQTDARRWIVSNVVEHFPDQ